jgi:hypothetical protein
MRHLLNLPFNLRHGDIGYIQDADPILDVFEKRLEDLGV